jgi:DeoR family fructose operon transcriptional repressor
MTRENPTKEHVSLLTLTSRQREILRLLEGKQYVRIKELADELEVTSMTIRRDVGRLEEVGMVGRLHGYCRLSERGAFDRAFSERMRLNRTAKVSIGERGVGMLSPGQVVFIDSGSTPLAVASALVKPGLEGLTVVTSALPVLWELYDAPHVRVMAMGGDLDRATGRLYGPLTENMLNQLAVDYAFVGADGINPRLGFCADTPETARTVGAMRWRARHLVVVADASKVERHAPYVYAPLSAALLITDHIPADRRDELRAAGLVWQETEPTGEEEGGDTLGLPGTDTVALGSGD